MMTLNITRMSLKLRHHMHQFNARSKLNTVVFVPASGQWLPCIEELAVGQNNAVLPEELSTAVVALAGGQWLPDMKELAGGRDDWQHPGDAPERITWEAVRQYAPEVLLLCPCSSSLERSLGEVCDLAGQPGWWSLPAVRSGLVYICDHSLFSRPGPR